MKENDRKRSVRDWTAESAEPEDTSFPDEQFVNRWHPQKPEGVARTLAKAGYGSRAKTNQIVHSGRVAVDGQVVFDPAVPVDANSDIQLDGKPLVEVVRRYFSFNKPARTIFQAGDSGGRKLVEEFFPRDVPGLQPVGRLDARTSGIVLVSNHNAWNDRVVSNKALEKEYHVRVSGDIEEGELGLIRAGMALGNLGFVRPQSAVIVERTPKNTLLSLVVTDAKNRQIFHLFKNLRKEIESMQRVRISSVALGDLQPGYLRPLTIAEIQSLSSID